MLYIIWVCFGMCGLIGRDALLQWPQTKQKIEKKIAEPNAAKSHLHMN